MGIKLAVPAQYCERFEFVFHINLGADEQTVVCRAEIFERSVLKATLQIASKNQSRLEVTDAVLERCIRWANLQIREDLQTSTRSSDRSILREYELALPRWPS